MRQSIQKPGWVLPIPGIKFDFDFANGRYFGGEASQAAENSGSKSIQHVVQGSSMLTPSAFYVVDRYNQLGTVLSLAPRIGNGTGLWAEGKYTNSLLWSRDHTNVAWTKTTMTAAKNQPSAETNAAGVTTANSATSLTANANNATSLQTLASLTSATYKGGAWVKRLTGSGNILMTIDNVSYTDITALINSSTYTWITATPSQTLTSAIFGFKIATSGDAIAVDHCQLENNGYCTTPIPTTTAALTRSADEPAISDPGQTNPGDGTRLIRTVLCTGAPFWVYAAAAGNCTHTSLILTDGDFGLGSPTNGNTCFMASNGNSAQSFSANSSTFGLANINKVFGKRNGQGNSCSLNGGALSTPTAAAFISQTASFTHLGLGNNGAGSVPGDGYIARLAFGVGDPPDGLVMEITTVYNNQ